MAVDLGRMLDDLESETDVLRLLVADLDDAEMDTPTPAVGWTIRDQLTHIAYFDGTAEQAAVDPDGFVHDAATMTARGDHFVDLIAADHAHLPAAEVLNWLAGARRSFVTTFRALDPKTRLPWYGPDMSAASSVTARLMETWAHGQDVADALGVLRHPTDRLRHVAHLGVRTAGFAFTLHNRPAPADPIRVELVAPSGTVWEWGPQDAANRVTGPALDFCLVVTQRRHHDDTGLRIAGPVAIEWMSIAQAFAGAPGAGRAPRPVQDDNVRSSR